MATCPSKLLKQINEDRVLISHMESLSWSFFQQTSYKRFLKFSNNIERSLCLWSRKTNKNSSRSLHQISLHMDNKNKLFAQALQEWFSRVSYKKTVPNVGRLLLQSNLKIFQNGILVLFLQEQQSEGLSGPVSVCAHFSDDNNMKCLRMDSE